MTSFADSVADTLLTWAPSFGDLLQIAVYPVNMGGLFRRFCFLLVWNLAPSQLVAL
jgi:hypothetical protein